MWVPFRPAVDQLTGSVASVDSRRSLSSRQKQRGSSPIPSPGIVFGRVNFARVARPKVQPPMALLPPKQLPMGIRRWERSKPGVGDCRQVVSGADCDGSSACGGCPFKDDRALQTATVSANTITVGAAPTVASIVKLVTPLMSTIASDSDTAATVATVRPRRARTSTTPRLPVGRVLRPPDTRDDCSSEGVKCATAASTGSGGSSRFRLLHSIFNRVRGRSKSAGRCRRNRREALRLPSPMPLMPPTQPFFQSDTVSDDGRQDATPFNREDSNASSIGSSCSDTHAPAPPPPEAEGAELEAEEVVIEIFHGRARQPAAKNKLAFLASLLDSLPDDLDSAAQQKKSLTQPQSQQRRRRRVGKPPSAAGVGLNGGGGNFQTRRTKPKPAPPVRAPLPPTPATPPPLRPPRPLSAQKWRRQFVPYGSQANPAARPEQRPPSRSAANRKRRVEEVRRIDQMARQLFDSCSLGDEETRPSDTGLVRGKIIEDLVDSEDESVDALSELISGLTEEEEDGDSIVHFHGHNLQPIAPLQAHDSALHQLNPQTKILKHYLTQKLAPLPIQSSCQHPANHPVQIPGQLLLQHSWHQSPKHLASDPRGDARARRSRSNSEESESSARSPSGSLSLSSGDNGGGRQRRKDRRKRSPQGAYCDSIVHDEDNSSSGDTSAGNQSTKSIRFSFSWRVESPDVSEADGSSEEHPPTFFRSPQHSPKSPLSPPQPTTPTQPLQSSAPLPPPPSADAAAELLARLRDLRDRAPSGVEAAFDREIQALSRTISGLSPASALTPSSPSHEGPSSASTSHSPKRSPSACSASVADLSGCGESSSEVEDAAAECWSLDALSKSDEPSIPGQLRELMDIYRHTEEEKLQLQAYHRVLRQLAAHRPVLGAVIEEFEEPESDSSGEDKTTEASETKATLVEPPASSLQLASQLDEEIRKLRLLLPPAHNAGRYRDYEDFAGDEPQLRRIIEEFGLDLLGPTHQAASGQGSSVPVTGGPVKPPECAIQDTSIQGPSDSPSSSSSIISALSTTPTGSSSSSDDGAAASTSRRHHSHRQHRRWKDSNPAV